MQLRTALNLSSLLPDLPSYLLLSFSPPSCLTPPDQSLWPRYSLDILGTKPWDQDSSVAWWKLGALHGSLALIWRLNGTLITSSWNTLIIVIWIIGLIHLYETARFNPILLGWLCGPHLSATGSISSPRGAHQLGLQGAKDLWGKTWRASLGKGTALSHYLSRATDCMFWFAWDHLSLRLLSWHYNE